MNMETFFICLAHRTLFASVPLNTLSDPSTHAGHPHTGLSNHLTLLPCRHKNDISRYIRMSDPEPRAQPSYTPRVPDIYLVI